MSAGKQYSAAERGGGAGETGRMRAAILNQINSWWAQAKWADPDRADRIHEKMNEAPEKFITPNPGTNYREEASRIYSKIKNDYSLRGARDLQETAREYDDRAEAYYREKGREPEKNELGGAPEPRDKTPTVGLKPREPELIDRPAPEPDPEPVELPAPERVDITPGSDPAPVEVTSAEPQPNEPDTEPAETTETPEETRDYSGAIGAVRLVKDVITANYRAGKNGSTSHETDQRTLEAY